MAAREALPGGMSHLWSSARSALRRLSLRARLLLGLVLVAAIGLFAADVVVYGSIQSYLNAQVSNELQSAVDANLRAARALCPSLPGAGAPRLPLDTAVEVVGPSGSPLCSVPSSFHLLYPPSPTGVTEGRLFEAQATLNGVLGTYRVLPVNVQVLTVDGAGQGVALVAIPLGPLTGTLHRLLLVELTVSLVVLAALVGLGAVVVRVGLRPLGDIEETAAAIAAGDLSRRVEDDDERTEVGRLGQSLNVMLSTIESSFAEQQASEARLRRFLADASHELRTPVTSIRGYAELFRRGAAERPEDLRLAMRRIEDEAIRMGGLVEDLLLLARLDQGRPLEREPVDLSLIATDAAADAQVLDPDRPISLVTGAPVVVLGDEQRLRQVVTNLVQNALRHTPPGTPVTVRVAAAGGRARLSVHDEGPGITKEHAGRIFERFYRADPSRTRGSGGSGLGLSIVASIAASHGGRAYLDSGVPSGSTFVVELPLASGRPRPAPPAGSAGSGRAEPQPGAPGPGPLVEVGGVVEPAKRPAVTGDDEHRDRPVVGRGEGEG